MDGIPSLDKKKPFLGQVGSSWARPDDLLVKTIPAMPHGRMSPASSSTRIAQMSWNSSSVF